MTDPRLLSQLALYRVGDRLLGVYDRGRRQAADRRHGVRTWDRVASEAVQFSV
jgi:hypothetical protein